MLLLSLFFSYGLPPTPADQLVTGQQKAVGDAEKELKTLMAQPDEEAFMRYICMRAHA